MVKVKFENGTIVEFDRPPSEQAISEVAKKLGIKPSGLGNNIKNDWAERSKNMEGSWSSSSNPAEMYRKSLNIAGQTAGGVLDTVGEVGKSAFDTGVNALSKVVSPEPTGVEKAVNKAGLDLLQSSAGKKAIEIMKQGANAWENFKVDQPQLARDIENVINVAAVIPIVKTGASLVEGTAGLAKKGIDATAKGIAPALDTVGKITEKAGQKIAETAIPLSTQEAKSLLNYKAKTTFIDRLMGTVDSKIIKPTTAGAVAFEKGLVGRAEDIGVQAKRIMDETWRDNVNPVLNKVLKGEYIYKNDVFESIANRIKGEFTDPEYRKSMLNALDALQDDWKGINKFGHAYAQKVKSELYRRLPQKIWKGNDIGAASAELRKMLSQELRIRTRQAIESIKSSLIGEAAKRATLQAFDDYSRLKQLVEFGIKDMTGGGKKGGFGGFVTSLKENMLVPTQTIGGQLLNKGGQKLREFGDLLKK